MTIREMMKMITNPETITITDEMRQGAIEYLEKDKSAKSKDAAKRSEKWWEENGELVRNIHTMLCESSYTTSEIAAALEVHTSKVTSALHKMAERGEVQSEDVKIKGSVRKSWTLIGDAAESTEEV